MCLRVNPANENALIVGLAAGGIVYLDIRQARYTIGNIFRITTNFLSESSRNTGRTSTKSKMSSSCRTEEPSSRWRTRFVGIHWTDLCWFGIWNR